jgi:hypothetical protein
MSNQTGVVGHVKQSDYPNSIILYYISAMDMDGREVFCEHSQDENKVKTVWEQMKPDNYDMHLYKALAYDLGDDGLDLIHDEVIDYYLNDDGN